MSCGIGAPYAADIARTAAAEILDWIKEPFEWWNCGEFEPMLDHYAEDAEYDFSAVFTDTKPHRGRESLRRQWEEMLETWEGVRMDPLDAFDLGGGRFVLSLRLWGKGKLSGAEIDHGHGSQLVPRPSIGDAPDHLEHSIMAVERAGHAERLVSGIPGDLDVGCVAHEHKLEVAAVGSGPAGSDRPAQQRPS